MMTSPHPRKRSRGIQAVLGAIGATVAAVLQSPYVALIPPKIGIILVALGAAIAATSQPPERKS